MQVSPCKFKCRGETMGNYRAMLLPNEYILVYPPFMGRQYPIIRRVRRGGQVKR